VSYLVLALKKETYSALADMWALALNKFSSKHSLLSNICNSLKKHYTSEKKMYFLHRFLSWKSTIKKHTYFSDILVLNLFNIIISRLSFKMLLEFIMSSPFMNVLFYVLLIPKQLKWDWQWDVYVRISTIFSLMKVWSSMVRDWSLN
jgi:hypothetical protein